MVDALDKSDTKEPSKPKIPKEMPGVLNIEKEL